MTRDAGTDLDVGAFRTCLGQFPTGVCVVSAEVDGELLGMTISSFNSVSLAPPLILFSIDNTARGLAGWQRAAGYAVNVLSDTQSEVSNRFARPSPNKWEGVAFEPGLHGAPVLPGAAAVLGCSPYAAHQAGDHTLFIARVEAFTAHPSRMPLVFCKGTYAELKPTEDAAAIWPLDIHY